MTLLEEQQENGAFWGQHGQEVQAQRSSHDAGPSATWEGACRQVEGVVGWKRLASAELFSPMLSSTFATIPVVPTTFCTSNTSWSNSLQRQHIFPVGVAFPSNTASSAQAGTTLPRRVCIPLILHRPRCGSCSGGHWLGSHPMICSAGCTGPRRTILPPALPPRWHFRWAGIRSGRAALSPDLPSVPCSCCRG